jgi:hypothetical protein
MAPFKATALAVLVAALTITVPSVSAQTCKGQSCQVADASGSTGATQDVIEKMKGKMKSENKKGDACVEAWWKSGFNINSRRSIQSRAELVGTTLATDAVSEMLNSIEEAQVEELAQESLRGLECKPNILVFARGTAEPGKMGSFVGPPLAKQLNKLMPGQWDIRPVIYSARYVFAA